MGVTVLPAFLCFLLDDVSHMHLQLLHFAPSAVMFPAEFRLTAVLALFPALPASLLGCCALFRCVPSEFHFGFLPCFCVLVPALFAYVYCRGSSVSGLVCRFARFCMVCLCPRGAAIWCNQQTNPLELDPVLGKPFEGQYTADSSSATDSAPEWRSRLASTRWTSTTSPPGA
jgi:hypothetical protein